MHSKNGIISPPNVPLALRQSFENLHIRRLGQDQCSSLLRRLKDKCLMLLLPEHDISWSAQYHDAGLRVWIDCGVIIGTLMLNALVRWLSK